MPIVFEPRVRKRKVERRVIQCYEASERSEITLLRDMTGVQCERCGTPHPEPHQEYCVYNWKDQDVFMD